LRPFFRLSSEDDTFSANFGTAPFRFAGLPDTVTLRYDSALVNAPGTYVYFEGANNLTARADEDQHATVEGSRIYTAPKFTVLILCLPTCATRCCNCCSCLLDQECLEPFSKRVCYFEVKIRTLSASPNGVVSVGLALRDNTGYNEPFTYSFAASREQTRRGENMRVCVAKPYRLPVEWIENGNRKAQWNESGGDILGCGIDLDLGFVFFTVNGQFMTLIPGAPLLEWHACIGLGPGCSATVNLGSQVSSVARLAASGSSHLFLCLFCFASSFPAVCFLVL
jgi:hypothetical protein